jgi:hypothetical protein
MTQLLAIFFPEEPATHPAASWSGSLQCRGFHSSNSHSNILVETLYWPLPPVTMTAVRRYNDAGSCWIQLPQMLNKMTPHIILNLSVSHTFHALDNYFLIKQNALTVRWLKLQLHIIIIIIIIIIIVIIIIIISKIFLPFLGHHQEDDRYKKYIKICMYHQEMQLVHTYKIMTRSVRTYSMNIS